MSLGTISYLKAFGQSCQEQIIWILLFKNPDLSGYYFQNHFFI